MDAVVLTWPGGEHAFRLGLAQLEAIQQKTDCGPEHLLRKINVGEWSATELFTVLRLGLIGGGVEHVAALKIVTGAFEDAALIAFKVPAQAVLAACLYGPPDDQPGETLPVEPTPDS